MAVAHSKLTARGQVLVPAKVRQRLGVGPGSVLEWSEDGGRVIVRKAVRYSSQDIHRAFFSTPPSRQRVDQLEAGVRRHVKKRQASR